MRSVLCVGRVVAVIAAGLDALLLLLFVALLLVCRTVIISATFMFFSSVSLLCLEFGEAWVFVLLTHAQLNGRFVLYRRCYSRFHPMSLDSGKCATLFRSAVKIQAE